MSSNHIDTYLKTLSLHRISEIYLQEAENAANTKLSYQDYLLRLLEGISHEVSEGIPSGDGFAIKTQLHLENCRMGRCPVLSRRHGLPHCFSRCP